jgi:hypothetical protein
VAVEIRSYRSVFDLERRIYRIDRLRLNPGGVPVRGAVYFIVLLLATLAAGAVPLVGVGVRALPWYLRELAVPVGLAALLTVIRVEGRPFHLAARALVRYASGPRRLVGLHARRRRACSTPGRHWHPPELLLLPDGSDARLRRLRYTGPGAVLVAVAHERATYGAGLLGRVGAGARLGLRELPGRRALRSGQVIALAPGARLDVQGAECGSSPEVSGTGSGRIASGSTRAVAGGGGGR